MQKCAVGNARSRWLPIVPLQRSHIPAPWLIRAIAVRTSARSLAAPGARGREALKDGELLRDTVLADSDANAEPRVGLTLAS
jgi:hypothetical protein